MNRVTRAIFPFLLCLLASAEARPFGLLSLRHDQSIYAGIQYGSISLQTSLFLGTYTLSETVSGCSSISLSYENKSAYLFSLQKQFVQGDDPYQSGLEWLFGVHYYTGTEKHSKDYDNAFGYFIAKEYGRLQAMLGTYLNVAYQINPPESPWERRRLAFSPLLSLGARLRI